MKQFIRAGFTLLEVTVSILILGIMLPTLFYLINQSIQFKNTIESNAPRAAAEMYSYEVLFRDIAQLAVPLSVYEAWEKYSQPKRVQPSPDVESVGVATETAEESAPAPIFLLEKSDTGTLYIGFYSNNTLFSPSLSFAMHPVYIVYAISVKEVNGNPLYSLIRYEIEQHSVMSPAEVIKDKKGLVLYKDKKNIQAKVVLQSFITNNSENQEPSELLETWDPLTLWQESRQVIPNYIALAITDEFEQKKEYLFPVPASSYYSAISYEYALKQKDKESSSAAAKPDMQESDSQQNLVQKPQRLSDSPRVGEKILSNQAQGSSGDMV